MGPTSLLKEVEPKGDILKHSLIQFLSFFVLDINRIPFHSHPDELNELWNWNPEDLGVSPRFATY